MHGYDGTFALICLLSQLSGESRLPAAHLTARQVGVCQCFSVSWSIQKLFGNLTVNGTEKFAETAELVFHWVQQTYLFGSGGKLGSTGVESQRG